MRVVLEYAEHFNRHDVGAMTELMAGDILFRGCRGREAAVAWFYRLFKDYPLAKIRTEELSYCSPGRDSI